MTAAHSAQVIVVDPDRPDPEVIARAAAIIRAGGLVAFPTETVYGLGANGLDPAAVRRIFEAKRRSLDDPVILHLASAENVDCIVSGVSASADALAARFWPGPLTLVLPKRDVVPDVATAGLPSVAVRVPSHPVAQALILAAGVPVAAPSANLFMRTSATTAQHVFDDLGERVDLILDGGPTPFGIESTVVSATDAEVRLLRPGAVTPEALADALATLDPPLPLALGPAGRAASPGLMAKHYSPSATLFLIDGGDAAVRRELRAGAARALAAGRHPGLLLADEDVAELADLAGTSGDRLRIMAVGSLHDLKVVARRLFAALRELDAAGCDVIYARSFGTSGLGLAIMDRLTRAAHQDAEPPS
jgi:L-threonylcarbamoyladenylate synthase